LAATGQHLALATITVAASGGERLDEKAHRFTDEKIAASYYNFRAACCRPFRRTFVSFF
jgi:hypothetical protein